MEQSSFILLEGCHKFLLCSNSLIQTLEEGCNFALFLLWRKIDGHSKESIVFDAYSVMSRTTIARHINVSMPSRWPEIPLVVQWVNFAFCMKTKIQRWNNAILCILVAADRTVWSVGWFTRIIYEVILPDDIIAACVIAVCDVLIKILALRNKTELCWIANYICDMTISVFLCAFREKCR